MLLGILVLVIAGGTDPAVTEPTPVAGIHYVEQPAGIQRDSLMAEFPEVADLIRRIENGARAAVKADLMSHARTGKARDGELTLLAQLCREDGDVDQAVKWSLLAIARGPRQHLNHFGHALACFGKLQTSRGPMARWHWQKETLHAYEHAFALDPTPVPYRYYIAYSKLQTPALFGGDRREALRLADEAVRKGQREFLVVRADILRQTGQAKGAFVDYDACVERRIFKMRSFLGAFRTALDGGDMPRARRYAEYLVECRPDSPQSHAALAEWQARSQATSR